jgi:hypothetical protein
MESMIRFIKQWQSSSRETKWFVLSILVYLGMIVVTGIWCYARLDFVRTGPLPTQKESL